MIGLRETLRPKMKGASATDAGSTRWEYNPYSGHDGNVRSKVSRGRARKDTEEPRG